MPEKKLKPTLRENKRYLLLEGDFNKKDIEAAILDYLGVLGYAKASPMWISANILAVNREALNHVRASFVVGGKNIQVARVSGTLKKLRS